MVQEYACQAVAPLVGWEQLPAPQEKWSFGIPDSEQSQHLHGLITKPEYPLGREQLESMPALMVVSSYGTGYDYIDVEAASDLGILVTHTPEAVVDATAELGLTMVLALLRHVVPHTVAMRQQNREGEANPVFASPSMAHDIHGQKVGLVGYGRVGKRLADLLRLVGFEVFYTRPHGPVPGHGGFTSLDGLLAVSDFIVVMTPLSPSTRHLIGREALAQCKPTASLINISRGPCVDEAALIEALLGGEIAAAALDVFEYEPRISQELIAMPQVILSPHVGTTTWETRMRMTQDAVGNIAEALRGHAVNAVNEPEWRRRP